MKPSVMETNLNSPQCAIKQSQSLTSLPPTNASHDSTELGQAKLRIIDRPYNSLKKKRDSERDIWRRKRDSWESHSSCSLQSSATNTGSGTGKDEFWAALQTNYNYIMDTNLLDSCREARCEIEGAVVPELKLKMDSSEQEFCQPGTGNFVNSVHPRSIRRWIREMENRLANYSYTNTNTNYGELQKRLTEFSELYREIVSQARIIGACIRASEETIKLSEETGAAVSSSGNRKTDGSLKGLERRYHLLYLKAIEVQCLLEGLLGRKNSPSPVLSRSLSDTDEEPATKLARLNDSEYTYQKSKKEQGLVDVGFDGNRSEDEWLPEYLNRHPMIEAAQAADFDADSEGSDCEIIPKLTCTNGSGVSSNPVTPLTPSIYDQNMETGAEVNNELEVSTTTAIVNNTDPDTPKPKLIDTILKCPKPVDISKFNRSNRKSKNCAIFYFKHLDTDSEQRALSSQGSEAFRSGEPSSDDEWFYNENRIKQTIHFNVDCGDDVEEEHDNMNLNKVDSCNNINEEEESFDVIDGQIKFKNVRKLDSKKILETCKLPGFNLIDVNKLNETHQNGCKVEAISVNPHKTYKQYSKETIQQLVLGAESLIREEVVYKTPKIIRNSFTEVKVSSLSTPMICGNIEKVVANPKIKRVQEWLEHNPLNPAGGQTISAPTTDCDASGEYTTESDSAARDSDTSEGLADSIATCLQGAGSNSQATSSEVLIGGSCEPLMQTNNTAEDGVMPIIGNVKVIMRTNRRNSERPWSVSCLSQLTHNPNTSRSETQVNNQGLANFSISESALHTLSSPNTSETQQSTIRNSDSKGSLKKRRLRIRKRTVGRKSESGSDCTPHDEQLRIVKSESFSGQSKSAQDLSKALSLLSIPKCNPQVSKATSSGLESEEENAMMKPNFCLGAYTTVLVPGGASNLGSLAALANYNHDEKPELLEQELIQTGTEENSSFSEQAWDNYQEKYQSEPYSEGFDSDAARRLMEFGDDYRNFLDSQSDCCSSSLSAPNNLDSMSPPRNRKFIPPPESRSPSHTPNSSSLESSLRRRRALELVDLERRRKNSSGSKRMSSDERRRSCESSSSRKENGALNRLDTDPVNRKLEFDHFSPGKTRKKHSESDETTSRRRSLRSIDKIAMKSFSSSSNSDSEDDIEMRNLLAQSKNRLEHSEALRIRRHLLRPEDYAEIISTCRENIRCLEAVLRSSPGTVLSPIRCQETRELLSSWESLLNWSENAAVARQLQEEMLVLKMSLNRLSTNIGTFDSEDEIQYAIEELKADKLKLHTQRSTMLNLNASVHSWLTRQEMKFINKIAMSEQSVAELTDENFDELMNQTVIDKSANYQDNELHKYLKDEVGDMYSAWDEADQRITNRLESLTTSLAAWKQFEYGLNDFHETLGKDKGALCGLKGALDRGKKYPIHLDNNVIEVAKLLSERIDHAIPNQINTETLHSNLSTHPFNIKSSSNGSLSDSGISDGGCVSDGGLSERERRLGALRRLVRQLENALAPGSEALKSIALRMKAAEAELKSLQDTCRELIVRTTGNQQQQQQKAIIQSPSINYNPTNLGIQSNGKGKIKRSPQSKRTNKRRSVGLTVNSIKLHTTKGSLTSNNDPDPDDPKGNTSGVKNWMWRVAKVAVPIQLALITLFCAICLLEPHCCDSINNMSMSFTPQLRYVRGPPPI